MPHNSCSKINRFDLATQRRNLLQQRCGVRANEMRDNAAARMGSMGTHIASQSLLNIFPLFIEESQLHSGGQALLLFAFPLHTGRCTLGSHHQTDLASGAQRAASPN